MSFSYFSVYVHSTAHSGYRGAGKPCHAFLTVTRRLVDVFDWLAQVS